MLQSAFTTGLVRSLGPVDLERKISIVTFNEAKTWHFPDTHPKSLGPWDYEPDKVQWVDEETDLDCLIVRNHMGALCGYVGLPPGHALHGVAHNDNSFDEISVHGGLTFSDACDESAKDGRGVCHVPLPGRAAEVWWLGFDCGHAYDIIPRFLEVGIHFGGEAYRDINYVRGECEHLASQLQGPLNA